MHELSIAEQIVEIATDYAAREGVARVDEIELEIGTLSGIEIDALTFAMDVVTRDSVLDGAAVTILNVQAAARCEDCGAEFDIPELYTACAACGSFRAEILRGREMRVKTLLLND